MISQPQFMVLRPLPGVVALVTVFALVAVPGCGTQPQPDAETPPTLSIPKAAPVSSVSLSLQPGDHFPLVKTVVQSLSTRTASGSLESRSTLKMWLALKVEQVSDDGIKTLSVRYDRVRYHQNLDGETLEYDSGRDSDSELPMAVRIHAGVVNNGFAFRLGPDNQVRDVIGFDEFLVRCVRRIPEEYRAQTLAELRRTTGREGIATFVDESIGLLPHRKNGLPLHERWQREREISGAVPMRVSKTFELTDLEDRSATVSVSGTITPLDTAAGASRGRLLSGQIVGSCEIDRHTGVPIGSHLQRVLQLAVKTPDGREVPQKKVITTEIETYLPSPDQAPLRVGFDGE